MKKLKIAVNTRLLLKDKMDGIGWFTHESLKRLTRDHPEHEFYFIFDRPYDSSFIYSDNITPVVAGPVTRTPLLIRYWFNNVIPRLLKKIEPDLFLSPDGFLPSKSEYATYAVIHDLNFEHYPRFLPRNHRKLYRNNFRNYAQAATRIGTVSDYSKQDIASTYDTPVEKIDILYCGLNDHFKKPDDEASKDYIGKISEGNPYFLFTGTFHPRKNLPRLIKAFDRFKKETGSETWLVLAGNNKWASSDTTKALNEALYKHQIVVTGRIPSEKLNILTYGARAMVFVSLFEGFGIPMLEAAAAGIPLITSSNTSMAELAGDTALLVNPRNINEIASAMMKIDSDSDLRNTLAAKANQELGKYTWDQTAGLLWESIEKTISSQS
jgi:glycosyltransferase involved in cell wall biosynthesis